jgi:hypothetical protein
MSERKLAIRKKKNPKGRIVRVSNDVFNVLNRRRPKDMSWDSFMRKMLGLPDRSGNPQNIVEGYLEVTTGRFLPLTPDKNWRTLAEEAYEIAIVAAAKRGTSKVHKPIKLREA